MGNLVPIVVGALSRVGPSVLEALFAFLSKAAGRVFTTATDVVAWVKSNPLNAAIVAQGLVQSGMSVEDLLNGQSAGSDNAKSLLDSLRSLEAKIRAKEQSSFTGVDADDQLVADLERVRLGKILLRAFGTYENARDVQLALNALKLEDFDWLIAMRASRR